MIHHLCLSLSLSKPGTCYLHWIINTLVFGCTSSLLPVCYFWIMSTTCISLVQTVVLINANDTRPEARSACSPWPLRSMANTLQVTLLEMAVWKTEKHQAMLLMSRTLPMIWLDLLHSPMATRWYPLWRRPTTGPSARLRAAEPAEVLHSPPYRPWRRLCCLMDPRSHPPFGQNILATTLASSPACGQPHWTTCRQRERPNCILPTLGTQICPPFVQCFALMTSFLGTANAG